MKLVILLYDDLLPAVWQISSVNPQVVLVMGTSFV
jgi:hypothetical protein